MKPRSKSSHRHGPASSRARDYDTPGDEEPSPPTQDGRSNEPRNPNTRSSQRTEPSQNELEHYLYTSGNTLGNNSRRHDGSSLAASSAQSDFNRDEEVAQNPTLQQIPEADDSISMTRLHETRPTTHVQRGEDSTMNSITSRDARHRTTDHDSNILPDIRSTQMASSAPSTFQGQPLDNRKGIDRFLQIPLGDFDECYQAIITNAGILREDTANLQKEIVSAYQAEENDTGNRVVERLVILHHCQTKKFYAEEACRYINRLKDKDSRERKLFQQNYEKFRSHFFSIAQKRGPKARRSTQVHRAQSNLPMGSAYTPQLQYQSQDGNGSMAALATSRMAPAAMHQTQTSLQNMNSMQPQAGGRPFENIVNIQMASGQQPLTNLAHRPRGSTDAHSMTVSLSQGQNPRPAEDEAEFEDGSIISLSYVDLHPRDTFIGDRNGANYQPRYQDARNFFSRGRVFRMWWHEPAGKQAKTQTKVEVYKISPGPENTSIYSKLLWMVVIKNKKGYSICCPITTYDGRGLKKPGLDDDERKAHSIIYSNGKQPSRLPDEPHTTKRPIKVDSRTEYLHYAARVHFGKSHTVHWDASIMDMGRVIAEHRDLLSSYYLAEH